MVTISGVINTYNNDATLERCLASLKDCDEIVVCDMHSTDRTIEIAEKYGAKVVYHENVGHCDPARNFALSNATSDYALILDADEYASEGLIKTLKEFIGSQENPPEGIRIYYKNAILGKVLKSYSKKGILRCYKKGCVNYPPIIHSAPVVSGREEFLNQGKVANITHDMVTDITEHQAKWNQYTAYEVKEKFSHSGKKFKLSALLFRPLGEFIKLYFLKQGFRDGIRGYIFAIIGANYKFMALAKLWEKEVKEGKRE